MKSILIVLNEAKNSKKLKRFLEKYFEVYVSCIGEAVLGVCSEKKFDLIITDYSLKKIDGISLIKKVKEVQPDIKSILVSGTLIPDEGKIRRSGINAYIEKPLKEDVLKEVIELILG